MAEKSSARSSPAGPAKTRSSALEILAFLSFIILPLSVPVYKSSPVQQTILPAIRPYIPQQLQPYLPEALGVPLTWNGNDQLNAKDLLASCEVHRYNSEIISLDPLVIYINNFTSPQEAEELIRLGSPEFADSQISLAQGNTLASGRTSMSAPLEPSLPLVDCVLRRARSFMGSMLQPHEPFSTPQLVRYFPSQRFDLHTDFWPKHQIMNDGSGRLFNRVASFFVFLRDNCTDGYTYFPKVEPTGTSIDKPASEEQLQSWYGDKVERGQLKGEEKGVKFKPIQGNAVFWVNINENGQGDDRLIHAGLPVTEGEKIGMNLWPRKFYGRNEDFVEKAKERAGWSGNWKQ